MSVLAMLGGGDKDGDGTGASPPPSSLKRKRPALKQKQQQQQQQQQLLKSNAATIKSNEDVMKALRSQSTTDPLTLHSMAAKSAAGKDISGAGRSVARASLKVHKPTIDKPCSYFASGACSWGTNCKYAHDVGVTTSADKK